MKTPVQSRVASDRRPHSASRIPHSASRITHLRSGFTLLEVLVATGVLALMVTILFALFNEGSNAWRMGEKAAEVNQGVRTAMDLMIRETSLAVIDTTTNSQLKGLAVAIEKSATGETPATDPSPYGVYEELRFVAPVELGNDTTNTAYGGSGYRAFCGVRYYVAKGPEVNGRQSVLGNLIRVVYRTAQKGSPGSFYSNPWSLGVGIQTNTTVLAENVLTFRVQPAVRDSVQGVAPDNKQMFKDMNSDQKRYITSSEIANYTNYVGVYIGLSVVDSRLAGRINELGLESVSKTSLFNATTNWTLARFENYKP